MGEVKSHFRAKPLGKGVNPDWQVFKVLDDGDEQLVCTIPHWHDSAEYTAQTIAQSLENEPRPSQDKIGLKLTSNGEKNN